MNNNKKINIMNENLFSKIKQFYGIENYLILTILLFLLPLNTFAQKEALDGIPNVISFQGTISDMKGNLEISGLYTITFNLYSQKKGGTPVWSETQNDVELVDGKLQVLFGADKVANALNILFDKKYFIGIQINDQSELAERIELVSTPHSLGSKFAEEVSDNAITSEKFAPLSVTNSKIKDISITKFSDEDPDPFSIYWTILGNILYGPERNYLGTIEEKNFVIKTFSIQRMLFDPYGHVIVGTLQDSVNFEVIGFSTFSDDMHIKGKMGVGIDTDVSTAKLHVKSQDILPFRVDYNSSEIFTVDKNGHVIITSTADGDNDDLTSYPLFVDSKDQGIAIQIVGAGLFGEAYGGTIANSIIPAGIPGSRTNSFVTFFDDFLDGRAGRIAGENLVDYLADPKNIAETIYLPILITCEVIAIVNATSINVASILAFGAEIAEISAQQVLELSQLGVSYRSGFADYAEWLERSNPAEIMEKGEIVGVFSGKISKATIGADQLLCISHAPIVLGNMVQKEEEPLYEKVTFLGQVPIRVLGKVKEGDYIITSGFEDGTGIAISPELMTIDEYSKVVGRAWESSNYDGLNFINTAVGFNTRDIVKALKEKDNFNNKIKSDIKEESKRLSSAKTKISELNNKLDALYIELEILAKEASDKNRNKNSILTAKQKQ